MGFLDDYYNWGSQVSSDVFGGIYDAFGSANQQAQKELLESQYIPGYSPALAGGKTLVGGLGNLFELINRPRDIATAAYAGLPYTDPSFEIPSAGNLAGGSLRDLAQEGYLLKALTGDVTTPIDNNRIENPYLLTGIEKVGGEFFDELADPTNIPGALVGAGGFAGRAASNIDKLFAGMGAVSGLGEGLPTIASASQDVWNEGLNPENFGQLLEGSIGAGFGGLSAGGLTTDSTPTIERESLTPSQVYDLVAQNLGEVNRTPEESIKDEQIMDNLVRQMNGLPAIPYETSSINEPVIATPEEMSFMESMVSGKEPNIVFHGTPYNFDQFDLSKLGTGEGTNAFGPGFYFAENPEVAYNYAEKLAGRRVKNTPEEVATIAMNNSKMDKDIAIASLENDVQSTTKLLDQATGNWKSLYQGDLNELLSAIEHIKNDTYKTPKNILGIEIPDSSLFLDYDKLIGQQDPNIEAKLPQAQKALRYDDNLTKAIHDVEGSLSAIQNLGIPIINLEQYLHRIHAGDINGLASLVDEMGNVFRRASKGRVLTKDATQIGTLYEQLSQAWTAVKPDSEVSSILNDPNLDTEALAREGVKGVKYLDRQSRKEGEGTKNYVVFDPKDIKILDRKSNIAKEDLASYVQELKDKYGEKSWHKKMTTDEGIEFRDKQLAIQSAPEVEVIPQQYKKLYPNYEVGRALISNYLGNEVTDGVDIQNVKRALSEYGADEFMAQMYIDELNKTGDLDKLNSGEEFNYEEPQQQVIDIKANEETPTIEASLVAEPISPKEELSTFVDTLKNKYGEKSWRKKMTTDEGIEFRNKQLAIQGQAAPEISPRKDYVLADNERVDIVYDIADQIKGIIDEQHHPQMRDAISNSIQRGIEAIEQLDPIGQLKGKNYDIVVSIQRLDPKKIVTRGDAIYGSEKLTEVVNTGKDLVPINVGKQDGTLYLQDGHHRLRAYQAAGKPALSLVTEIVPNEGGKRKVIFNDQSKGNISTPVIPPSNVPPKTTETVEKPEPPARKLQNLSIAERAALPVLRNLSKASPETGKLMKSFDDYHTELSSEGIYEIRKATQGVNKAGEQKIIRFLDGEDIQLDQHETRVAKDLRAVLNNIANLAGQNDVLVGYREGYFPRKYEDRFEWDVTPRAFDSKNKTVGSLEKSRKGNRQNFRRDFKVLEEYINEASRRISESKFLGKDLSKVLPQDERALAGDRPTAEYVSKSIKRVTGREGSSTPARFSDQLRRITALGDLGLAVLYQPAQFAHTASAVGLRRATRAAFKALSNTKEETLNATRSGALWPTISHEVSRAIGDKGYMHLIPTVDKMMRVHANVAGRLLAQDALKGNSYAKRQLDDLKIKLDDPKLFDKVGNTIADKTQFRTGTLDLPLWTHSPLGKLAFQYSSFAYAQAKFAHDMLRHPVKNFGQIVRFAAMGAILGEGVGDLREMLRSLIPGKDEEDDILRRMMEAAAGDDSFDSKPWLKKLQAVTRSKRIPTSSPGWRTIQNLSMVGGIGIFQNVLEKATSGRFYELPIGPAGSMLVDTAEAGRKDIQKGIEKDDWKFSDSLRNLIGNLPLPLLSNRKLADTIVPKKDRKKAKDPFDLMDMDFKDVKFDF